MTGSKPFCLLTFGRAGSTALIKRLEQFPDIMVPNKQIDCPDNELIHLRHTEKHLRAYEQLCARSLGSLDELINCFYTHNANAPYCGFKTMPERIPNFPQLMNRPDLRFITLIRTDIPSTVASFMLAMTQGTWRRDGGTPDQRWTFTPDMQPRILGNLTYILMSLEKLRRIPNAIRLTYEDLCQPDFNNAALNNFFDREVRLTEPRPPTSGAKYVTNWDEFSGFVIHAGRKIQKGLATSTP